MLAKSLRNCRQYVSNVWLYHRSLCCHGELPVMIVTTQWIGLPVFTLYEYKSHRTTAKSRNSYFMNHVASMHGTSYASADLYVSWFLCRRVLLFMARRCLWLIVRVYLPMHILVHSLVFSQLQCLIFGAWNQSVLTGIACLP